MPHINEIKQSRFLRKEDAGPGILLTIIGCEQTNVGPEDGPTELEWILKFQEPVKPMVLKSTNAQLIAGFLGSENTDDWIGRKIVAYNDPNVTMKGKITGGLRVRAPRNQPAAAPAQPQSRPVSQPAPAQPQSQGATNEEDVPF